MAYISWTRLQYKLPNYDTKVLVTVAKNDNPDERMVVEAFLEYTDAAGHHWIFGFNNEKLQAEYTVIAWTEKPDPRGK